jgi:hypothetical protein
MPGIGIGVDVGVGEGGMGVDVGVSVAVGGIDVGVFVDIGAGAGAHPLNKTIRNTNTRKTDSICFFMTLSPFDLIVQRSRRTVCVSRVWAGVDSVWEQKKLEARKMLVNRAESHLSGARFVGRLFRPRVF